MANKKKGRPIIDIDKNQFEKLCFLQCTEEEIAGFFDCSIDTINNYCKRTYDMTFSDVYKKKSSKGKISLRRSQFKIAEKNATMAIWLGKQYLGQIDAIENNVDIQRIEIINDLPSEQDNATS